jgi:hypothetical protein
VRRSKRAAEQNQRADQWLLDNDPERATNRVHRSVQGQASAA